jgi:electron transport complex protein RnfG
MKEYIRMITVLTAISALCGLLLAAVQKGTEKQIEMQILNNVQGPAVTRILASSTNDFIQERETITINENKHTIFIGKKQSKPWAVAYESSGTGFGGEVGVMVGFDIEQNKLTGIGILTHQETPGLGARITEGSFTAKFKDQPLTSVFKVKKDDGIIDAVSGATYSSRAVCEAVRKCIKLLPQVKKNILENKN